MILSLLFLILIGVVAYWHYLQGFFSAGISAVLAVIAAVFAVAYHETLIGFMLGGALANQATAIALVGIFVLSYSVMRFVFDKAVPGNLRFPVLVDRIGAGAMGVVAGLAGTGIVAIAAQSLPFGRSIAMYERYPSTYNKWIAINRTGQSQMIDAAYDELNAEKFLNNNASRLWVPADELLLALVDRLSLPGGSLSNGRSFGELHPDFLQELFGQRLNVLKGGKRTAMLEGSEVKGVFVVEEVQQKDPEQVKGRGVRTNVAPVASRRSVSQDRKLLVVRASFSAEDADANSLVSMTPSAIRLSGDGSNYFPIGTMEGQVLYLAAPDDQMFVPTGNAVDFVFDIPQDLLVGPAGEQRIAPGMFIEMKRYARVSLEGRTVRGFAEAARDQKVGVLRKEGVVSGAAAGAGVDSGSGGEGALLAEFSEASPTALVIPAIATGGSTGTVHDVAAPWGTFSVENNKFTRLNMMPMYTLERIGMGGGQVSEFAAPEGQQMVQITCRPGPDVANKWAFADRLADYALVDASGGRHACKGAMVVVNNNTKDMLCATYAMSGRLDALPKDETMRPTTVNLLFTVPSGLQIRSLDFAGKPIQPIQLDVP